MLFISNQKKIGLKYVIYIATFTREKFNALRAFIYKARRAAKKVGNELAL